MTSDSFERLPRLGPTLHSLAPLGAAHNVLDVDPNLHPSLEKDRPEAINDKLSVLGRIGQERVITARFRRRLYKASVCVEVERT